jgi:hypothetical protein
LARTKHITFETGKVLGSALTGSYAAVMTATQDAVIVQILNSCSEAVFVSFNNGTTSIELDGEGFVLDLRANDYLIGKPVIVAKHAGVVPASGSIRVIVGLA